MTLTEYLNQDDPVKMPHVELEDDEVKFGIQYMIARAPFIREVTILALWEKYQIPGTYIQKNRELTLWTSDQDGNPVARSCFSLINPYASTNN